MKYNGLYYNAYNIKELENVTSSSIGSAIDTSYHEKPKIGQLKLLLNEIAFIEYMNANNYTCTPFQVCGGGPGSHYAILADMYPKIQFSLYDKTEFDKQLINKSNITLHSKYVNPDIAEREFDPSGVFVSDMRSLNVAQGKRAIESNYYYESIIARDMYDQLIFFYASKCKHSMLKFKVPNSYSFSFPFGELWLQPFINTNEMRIHVTQDADVKVYNGNEIDRKCQMINNYWKNPQLKISIDEWPRRDDIKRVLDNNKKLKFKWDNIALVDLLLLSKQIHKLDDIINIYKLDDYRSKT